MGDTFTDEEWLDRKFDDLLFQTTRLTHDQIESGRRIEQLEQVKGWKSLNGYKFNIYSNDHLINGKKHFHLDNQANNIHAKLDFDGNILESTGKNSIPKKVMDDLKYFLKNTQNNKLLNDIWDKKNPKLKLT